MATTTKQERIKAVLAGEQPERPLASFWRHFFREESSAEGLASAMLAFQEKYDWDFMKVNPRAGYHAEPWGNRYTFHDDDRTEPTLQEPGVKDPGDWQKLQVVPADQGVLGEHLEALRLIRKGLGGDVPYIMTVFTPLSIASRLVGSDEELRRHIDTAPEALEVGLRTITETFKRFSVACLDQGCAGLYYATTRWGASDIMTWPEYERFSYPYDLEILGALDDRAWLTVLHVCQPNCYLEPLLDLPVQAVSWDVTHQHTPDLAEIAKKTDKTLIGGITQVATNDDGNRRGLVTEASMALEVTGNRRWILGAGCCVPVTATDGNLQALRDWADSPNR